jgi:hypothetical protein
MFETLLGKAIRCFLSYFNNPVSGFSFTYQGELIDGAYEDWGEGITLNLPTAAAVLYEVQTLLHSPPHDVVALGKLLIAHASYAITLRLTLL